ncbi:unnamed protein product [Alternaria alternata]
MARFRRVGKVVAFPQITFRGRHRLQLALQISSLPPQPGRLRKEDRKGQVLRASTGITFTSTTETWKAASATHLPSPDNWDEYVYLMERLHYNEISAHEFDSRAKFIFQVFGEKTRKKLNNILVMKMILPRLEEIELEGRGQTTKSVENN